MRMSGVTVRIFCHDKIKIHEIFVRKILCNTFTVWFPGTKNRFHSSGGTPVLNLLEDVEQTR